MDVRQLIDYVIEPVLRGLDMYSVPALTLVAGTAAQESHLIYIQQLGGGPARGLWQMEPATHDDIWGNYLRYKPAIANDIKNVTGVIQPSSRFLTFNLYYACAMCRAHYRRRPEPLPGRIDGQARYWKAYYNTFKGAGTEQEYIASFRRLVLPELTAAERSYL